MINLNLGIFRVPGDPDDCQRYKREFNEGKEVQLKCTCHDAVDLIKLYLRGLPEPIIPNHLDSQLQATVGINFFFS